MSELVVYKVKIPPVTQVVDGLLIGDLELVDSPPPTSLEQ